MLDKIVTLNDILVGVFCKSGENVWYLFFAQKNKNKIAIKLNRKLFNFGGGNNNNLKQYIVFMLKPFLSFTLIYFIHIYIYIIYIYIYMCVCTYVYTVYIYV